MKKYLKLIGCLVFSISTANANNLLAIKFELIQDKKITVSGNTFVSQEKSTWRKGYKQRFLKLNCQQLPSGDINKQISSENHFAGLRISHQIVGDYIELNVERNIVKSRIKEIQALDNKTCKNLSPIITNQT